jgi:HD-like signal output (HDOD) protein
MDGAQLLTAVRQRYPATARLVLSGHADRASIISAIGPTQQYLAKPCDVDTLVDALDRVLAVRGLVDDDRLRSVLGDVESLPKPPGVHTRMLELSSNPDCQIDDVVAVIEEDVATCAEVLHLVNSSFFGLPHRVESISRAVGLLGLETIQALAVAGAVFRQAGPAVPGLDLRTLGMRGLRVGRLAQLLTKDAARAGGTPPGAANEAFFAGLLHEVGLIALAAADPRAWASLRGRSRTDPWQADAEQVRAFGVSATRASAYLLGLWGFSAAVVEPIAIQPVDPDDPAQPESARLLTLARTRADAPTR